MADTTVKYFHSAMSGAPVLSGTAGSLIAVLDACLVNGFGLKSVGSLVVVGGVATMTISGGHPFEADVVALVSGAAPAGLNGEKKVLSVTGTTVSFDATGISDQTATGTITVKLASAGWQKAFSGTNLAAYRSQDAAGTRMYLRVDDTGTTNARVVGYETMTDVNTGLKPFPTAIQQSGGGYWPKANASDTINRAWTVVADSRAVWLHTHTNSSAQYYGVAGAVWGFGDFTSYKSGDPFSCMLWCTTSDESNSASTQRSFEYCGTGGITTPYLARSFTGLGGSQVAVSYMESYITASGNSGGSLSSMTPGYPNSANNGLILSRKLLVEQSITLRGYIPGLLLTPQGCHSVFSWRDKIDGQGTYAGRKLLAVKCGSPNSGSSNGVVFFDITGPWR